MLGTIPTSLLSRISNLEAIELIMGDYVTWDTRPMSMHPTLLLCMPTFYPHVHTLRLGPILITSHAEFARLLCAFPALRRLRVNDVSINDEKPIPEFLERRVSQYVTLASLEVRMLQFFPKPGSPSRTIDG